MLSRVRNMLSNRAFRDGVFEFVPCGFKTSSKNLKIVHFVTSGEGNQLPQRLPGRVVGSTLSPSVSRVAS